MLTLISALEPSNSPPLLFVPRNFLESTASFDSPEGPAYTRLNAANGLNVASASGGACKSDDIYRSHSTVSFFWILIVSWSVFLLRRIGTAWAGAATGRQQPIDVRVMQCPGNWCGTRSAGCIWRRTGDRGTQRWRAGLLLLRRMPQQIYVEPRKFAGQCLSFS